MDPAIKEIVSQEFIDQLKVYSDQLNNLSEQEEKIKNDANDVLFKINELVKSVCKE